MSLPDNLLVGWRHATMVTHANDELIKKYVTHRKIKSYTYTY